MGSLDRDHQYKFMLAMHRIFLNLLPYLGAYLKAQVIKCDISSKLKEKRYFSTLPGLSFVLGTRILGLMRNM
eukprot:528125-Ditylum_brightwellii.AAC.1